MEEPNPPRLATSAMLEGESGHVANHDIYRAQYMLGCQCNPRSQYAWWLIHDKWNQWNCRNRPKYKSTKIKTLQQIIKKITDGYMSSYAKTWTAKQMVTAKIHKNWEESHETLPIFPQVIKQSNPSTQTRFIYKDSGTPRCATFHSLYWAFVPAIKGFKHCQTIICFDGTFLTGKYKDTLLIVVSQDSENQIFPIAFAIVEKENKENWVWFLACIRHFITGWQGLCLIRTGTLPPILLEARVCKGSRMLIIISAFTFGVKLTS